MTSIEASTAGLADGRRLVGQFGTVIRTRDVDSLEAWIEQAQTSLTGPLPLSVVRELHGPPTIKTVFDRAGQPP